MNEINHLPTAAWFRKHHRRKTGSGPVIHIGMAKGHHDLVANILRTCYLIWTIKVDNLI